MPHHCQAPGHDRGPARRRRQPLERHRDHRALRPARVRRGGVRQSSSRGIRRRGLHVRVLRERRPASRAGHRERARSCCWAPRSGLRWRFRRPRTTRACRPSSQWRRSPILRTVATERAPVFFTSGIIERAFALAELRGHFRVDAVSPVEAAAGVLSPVLLIHGEADVDTRPEHSRRVLAALAGPKRLILVPGARHNESLRGDVWGEIEHWLDAIVPRPD